MSFGARDLSVVRNSEVVRYLDVAVGTATVVRYSGDVRYWECPLPEVPLYSVWEDRSLVPRPLPVENLGTTVDACAPHP